ncbi:MAG: alpha/beta hydrolase [Roseburia sp.]|jgi:pimeloyl-ACP methyl ester carboxylesterase|nr:alpha/beta hydrolase [Roseburia sp.]
MKKNIKHVFFLTAVAAGAIHLANRFVDITAEMKNILKSQDGEYYHWKNGNIFYTRRGSGSPVLLIHELNPISSSYEWCRLVKKLEKDHTVYTIDLLGCGRSEKPYLTYTNYLYVQLITDFIQQVIGTQPDVITTSNSVSFAVLAQNMNQDLIRRIIAINPPSIESFERTTDQFSMIRKFLIESPLIGTFLYNIRTHESNIAKELRNIYFCRPQLVSSKMLDAYYEAAHMEKGHGKYLMASIEAHYTDNAIDHALKNISIPICIIESNTIKNAVSIAEAYARKNSLIETTYLSNAKLVPQLEMPDKLLTIIGQFLHA